MVDEFLDSREELKRAKYWHGENYAIRKFRTVKITGGKTSTRRKFHEQNFHAAKIPDGENSEPQDFYKADFHVVKLPRGENSARRN